jgi:small-conductance mechanosensitive channel
MDNSLLRPLISLRDVFLDKLPELFWGLVGLILVVLIGKLIQKLVTNRLSRRMDDKLLADFVGKIIYAFFLIAGIVIFLQVLGLGQAVGGLLAGAGVTAIVLGFAFKDIGENFLAGIFLAFGRPFSIGDLIEVQSIKGLVREMNFRNTHVRTYDGKDIYVPNALLFKQPLTNYTRDGLLRYDFTIGIDYEDDIKSALEIALQTLNTLPEIEKGKGLEPFVAIEEFATSTINMKVFYWVNVFNKRIDVTRVKNETMTRVIQDLTAKGFSLPADILELKSYRDNKLNIDLGKENKS